MSETRPMILTAALMHGLGMHTAAWMVRDGDASDFLTADYYKDIARTAEAGKLHAVFLAEQLTNQETGADRPAGALDTAIVLSLMAGVTEKIGLVGTGSTTYNEPYELARRFATLDHLSGGRVGWNSVATQNPGTADMFGGVHPDHEERYVRADEFIDVVLDLWSSWDEGALVSDKANRRYAIADKIHEINHVGKYFKVRGPLPFPRTPQGRPVIFQAGSSESGREQAARFADCVFTAQHVVDDAVAFRNDLRRRVVEKGRDADSIKIIPGMSIILGSTETEARERKMALDDALGIGPNLSRLSKRLDVSIEVLRDHLDEPVPFHLLGAEDEMKGSIGFRRSILSLAAKENLTVRELIRRYGGGHNEVVGTPEQIADIMQEWIGLGAADGFTLMIDMLPSGVHEVVELLVPELQRRGLFHEDYEHTTLRDSLGLGAPARVAVPV